MWTIRASLFAFACTAAAATIEDCGGYTASNIAAAGNTLTADLTLNGQPCNVYGDDLADLKLLVEYQTGKLFQLSSEPASA